MFARDKQFLDMETLDPLIYPFWNCFFMVFQELTEDISMNFYCNIEILLILVFNQVYSLIPFNIDVQNLVKLYFISLNAIYN